MPHPDNRCRLVLVAPEAGSGAIRSGEPVDASAEAFAAMLADALRGGDVASVILPQYDMDEHSFQRLAEKAVPLVQAAGAAALIAGDTRIAGRVRADGLHVTGGAPAVAEAMERFAPRLIVGGGQPRDRHAALEIGEARPDYVFFGKLDGDIKPEPHPKNLALGEWWASMVEIPCIVMAGTAIGSVGEVAATGAEFVALRQAVFAAPGEAAQRVAEANALLDETAPPFED